MPLATADKVAKKSGRPAPQPDPDDRERKPMAIQIRGGVSWKAWVDKLAEFDERSVAVLVERALREYAERVKFPELPPRR